jgi:hypothetical protein
MKKKESPALKVYTLNGKKICLQEECRKRGLDYPAIYARIAYGYSVKEALSKPVRKTKKFFYKGKNYTLKELCAKEEWDFSFIANKLYVNKVTFEEAVEAYLRKKNPVKRNKKKAKEYRRVEEKIKKLEAELKKERKKLNTMMAKLEVKYKALILPLEKERKKMMKTLDGQLLRKIAAKSEPQEYTPEKVEDLLRMDREVQELMERCKERGYKTIYSDTVVGTKKAS